MSLSIARKTNRTKATYKQVRHGVAPYRNRKGGKMPILKAISSDVVIMDRAFLVRNDISMKAKGLLASLLSLPSTTHFSVEQFAKLHKESTGAVRSALRELMEHDYIRRNIPRNEQGKIENTVYTICDVPINEFENIKDIR